MTTTGTSDFAAGYGFTSALAPDLPPEAEIVEVVRLAKLPRLADSESDFVAKNKLAAFKPGGEHTVYGHPDGNVVKIAKLGSGMTFTLKPGATPDADRIALKHFRSPTSISSG